MWQTILSSCVLACLWRLSSTVMVDDQTRSAFNKALRPPLLEQVGLELKATKALVEKDPIMFANINKCKVDVGKKYYQCAECLSAKYKERNPNKFLSVSNALMSLCSYTDIDYDMCQLILDHELPFLEFIKRATKRVQRNMFSVLTLPDDAGPLLDVFQNFLNEQWTSTSAADVRKAVNDAKLAIQTPQPQGQRVKRSSNTDSELLRTKRWTKILKSMMEKIPKMMKSGVKKYSNPEFMSYMHKYMHMGKGFGMPKTKKSSTSKIPEGHLRTKRWVQMLQSIMKSVAPNNTNAVTNIVGSIQQHIPWSMPAGMMTGAGARTANNGESETLKCYKNGKCNEFITACASSSCPEPHKNMISDVCVQSLLPVSHDITNRLKRTRDIFDAVRTKQDFMQSITYNNKLRNNYNNVRMTADVQRPNIIHRPSLNTYNMQQAARNNARDIMKGLLPSNKSPM